MRILELTNYTSGGCGVGMRTLREAQFLSEKGHKVMVFSTNREKGTGRLCVPEQNIGQVHIKRFPRIRLGGESYMYWNFTKEALNFKPDVIITHAYRHHHTTKALSIAKKLKCKVFLVTHAPFERKKSRSWLANKVVQIYDNIFAKRILNKFDKVIAITQWEIPYLKKLGLKENKLEYIPNGISEIFFKPIQKIDKDKITKIVYTGRISPIKDLETISYALAYKREDDFSIRFRGPADESYLKKLKNLAKEQKIENREIFISKPYSPIEQINELQNGAVFILPSKSEGMPQTLVEAMAMGRIVVGSNNEGNKELIRNGKNGFLFEIGNYKSLGIVLDKIKKLNQKEISRLQANARKTAEKFKWGNIISKMLNTLSN